jgi:hypothetical protein
MRYFLAFSLLFTSLMAAADAQLGCDMTGLMQAVTRFQQQGYKIARIFPTEVLVSQFGPNKNYQTMDAYALENADGDTQFATCRGVTPSPVRAGTYISGEGRFAIGASVEVVPMLTDMFEFMVRIHHVTGILGHGAIPGNFTPVDQQVYGTDRVVKINADGQVYSILLNTIKYGQQVQYTWGKASRIKDSSCLAKNLPFSQITFSGATVIGTAESYQETLSKAKQSLTKASVENESLCKAALGAYSTCKKIKFGTEFECGLKGFEDDLSHSGTFTYVKYTHNPEALQIRSEGRAQCLPLPDWSDDVLKKCELVEIRSDTNLVPTQPTLLQIRNTAQNSDIDVVKEIQIPPAGAAIKIQNDSVFTVDFSGSVAPAQGQLKPNEFVIIKAMAGGTLKLSPYPGSDHYISFRGSN